jgi:hypothetical protein
VNFPCSPSQNARLQMLQYRIVSRIRKNVSSQIRAWHPLVLSDFLFIVMLLVKRHEISFSHV